MAGGPVASRLVPEQRFVLFSLFDCGWTPLIFGSMSIHHRAGFLQLATVVAI
jgi:hypothetical protein